MSFTPNYKSLRKHEVPTWFHAAKFGIFIHWSLSSVPAFAVADKGDIKELIKKEGFKGHFKNNPYAEWYLNTLRIEGSPTQEYHKITYGEKFSYDDIVPIFNEAIKKWDPHGWAELFKRAGARYVVLVTKHHDGFLLWPSKYANPHKENYFASRDIVGELTSAVTSKGMKMGFYYSGALDWTFNENPIKDMVSFVTNGSLDPEYAEYVDKHWYELIDSYSPIILWNDIGYPPAGKDMELMAYFYNKTPDGVVNDRWTKLGKLVRNALKLWPVKKIVGWIAKRVITKGGGTGLKPSHYDFRTPEYAHFRKIKKFKWECTRGIGNSFGYNKMEPESNYLTLEELVHMFVDIVSKNGNLLLNVGPTADGTIPEIQKNLILNFGKWLEINGEGIYGTRPWIRAESKTLDGLEVRYTQKNEVLYAFLLGKPTESPVVIESLNVEANTEIDLLGYSQGLKWQNDGENLSISITDELRDAPAYTLKLNPKPAE
ncbi:MAG: alpha-L-fucosidase [Candidatus Helarchaeota archaeon]|nr:alpha-L-fucosidase [Candidatus Helarchaeota archaeon]